MSEIGSPGIMHDVDLTIEHAPTTPRQIIGSLPTTPRQRVDNVFGVPPWDATNPLHGLHVVQVDGHHFFARWRYKFERTIESAWHELSDPPWLRNVRSERTYGLVPEREAIVLCRYLMHVYLCVMSSATILRGFSWSENVDLIIYICHNLHTQTVSVRFTAEGTPAKISQNRAMGFELVTSFGEQTCKFAQWESWIYPQDIVLRRLLKWRWVFVDKHELRPFTWPSNDEDVQRVQFFTSQFGHATPAKNSF